MVKTIHNLQEGDLVYVFHCWREESQIRECKVVRVREDQKKPGQKLITVVHRHRVFFFVARPKDTTNNVVWDRIGGVVCALDVKTARSEARKYYEEEIKILQKRSKNIRLAKFQD